MKNIIKLEELGMFLLGVYGFSLLNFSWWWFVLLLFTPDVGMFGYLFGNKFGAFCYNIFHHKGIAVLVFGIGWYINNNILELIGIILFSHSSLDRILGYGLKYKKGFKFTHLGEIGS